MLEHRPFKEDKRRKDNRSYVSNQNVKNPAEVGEIQEIDIMVLKPKCLSIGKRLTWHLDRINNNHLNLHTILENLEHISYPIRLKINDQKQMGKIISDKSPLYYTQKTYPSFFYNEYKVAIIVDL